MHAYFHDHSVVVACKLPPLPSTAGVVRVVSSTAKKMSGVAEKMSWLAVWKKKGYSTIRLLTKTF